ncbi:thioredoxin [Chryseobacterium arthrosphaerae]|uniref:Thioredoxin n=1 Tax=Chryseobacterium arthrosphaerae TaxID=651561 RepID=A0A3S0Q841_9FLAO|nr:thioredoxin [Chryseobacterium arthrosphaerae]
MILSFLIGIGISMNAQSKGINFQKLIWKPQKNRSKENKLIFIDLYTTWCGPCKLMAKILSQILKLEKCSTKFCEYCYRCRKRRTEPRQRI